MRTLPLCYAVPPSQKCRDARKPFPHFEFFAFRLHLSLLFPPLKKGFFLLFAKSQSDKYCHSNASPAADDIVCVGVIVVIVVVVVAVVIAVVLVVVVIAVVIAVVIVSVICVGIVLVVVVVVVIVLF